jgi:hypothetical protein
MLRNAVFTVAIVALVGGALAAAAGAVGLWVVVVWAAILAAGIAFERFRYKPLKAATPGPGWEKTSERFVDDETGKTVTVYVETRTGERQYVEDT